MIKEAKLMIETSEEDEILLGYLDDCLTKNFKMKSIQVNLERIDYK